MKKIKNSYKKSGVNISLANKLVKHISKISKKDVKKTKNLLKRCYWRFWFTYLILVKLK
jgi:hypothetical protein